MYYVVYGVSYLVSLLPMRLLYLLADGLSLFTYYVIRYRRRVVMDNLQIAFPEKTATQRRQIAKKFYRNFVDNFIDTLNLLPSSLSFIPTPFPIHNPHLLYTSSH